MNRSDIWTTPNILSILRIGIVPLFIPLLYSPGVFLSLVSAILFLVASITDLLDGYIARNYGTPSRLGRFLDPLADKLLIATCLVMLVPLDRVPAWIASLIIMREIAITGLRGIALVEEIEIKTSRWGKYKTLFQIASITCLILYYPFWGIDFFATGRILLWIALVLTLWSGGVYLVRFLKEVMEEENG